MFLCNMLLSDCRLNCLFHFTQDSLLYLENQNKKKFFYFFSWVNPRLLLKAQMQTAAEWYGHGLSPTIHSETQAQSGLRPFLRFNCLPMEWKRRKENTAPPSPHSWDCPFNLNKWPLREGRLWLWARLPVRVRQLHPPRPLNSNCRSGTSLLVSH